MTHKMVKFFSAVTRTKKFKIAVLTLMTFIALC